MPSSPGIQSPASLHRQWFAVAAGLLLMVPWLNPFAPGPSPALTPWLVALACAALLLVLAPFISVQVVARAWLAAALVSAVIGLLQYTGWARPFAPWVNQTVLGEAFGNLRQRNQFASLMSIGLAVLVWHSIPGTGHGRQRWMLLLAAALLAAASALSASRTGLVQLALISVLALLWHPANRSQAWRLVIAAVLAYLLATVLLPLLVGQGLMGRGVFARIVDDAEPCTSRITLWANVLHLIAQRPWTGWGWGELDYAHFATLYPGERFCDILDNAHNLPLQLAVELGIPAAILICGLALWLVLRARPWREVHPVRQLAWAVLLLIGVHSMLEYPLWYGPFLTAAVLSVAMLWSHPASGLRGQVSERRPPAGWRLVVVFILLPALCYVAWDYRRVSQIYTAPDERAPEYRSNTLAKVRSSWLFAPQVRFAELTMSPVTRANAHTMYQLANASLHYSPEPAVIERLIESAVMLGRDDEAIVNLARYKAAFPKDHAAWAQANLRAVQKQP